MAGATATGRAFSCTRVASFSTVVPGTSRARAARARSSACVTAFTGFSAFTSRSGRARKERSIFATGGNDRSEERAAQPDNPRANAVHVFEIITENRAATNETSAGFAPRPSLFGANVRRLASDARTTWKGSGFRARFEPNEAELMTPLK